MPPFTLFRYLSFRTLAGVGGLFILMAALVVLTDLIENLRFAGKVANGDFGFALMLTFMRTPGLSQALLPFVFLFGAMWAFNQLNRHSEISVMRSAGLSIWRLLGPAALIAAFFGALVVTAIDPLSTRLMAQAEKMRNDVRGLNSGLVQIFDDGIWLRQGTADNALIINARGFDEDESALTDVTVWRFDADSVFVERIDSPKAVLSGHTLELREARLKAIDDQKERRSPVYAIPTSLTPADMRERVAPPETMSIWQLPRFIPLAEAAGMPTKRYYIRFHDLCSTPLKLLAMVLIAATFSLRHARAGGGLKLFAYGVSAGFLLYVLVEISTALGESGVAPVALAAWTPALAATLFAVTGLLHLEDG
ncbi:MAG: LPS export ABC transporter permease LptG [Parvularculaceae bacterium]